MFVAVSGNQDTMSLGAGNPARFDEAREHILRAIKTFDELKLKPSAAVGQFCLGELSASSGQTAGATEHLRTADLMFSRMGMDLWLDKAQMPWISFLGYRQMGKK